jgi:hypothetical protein
MLAGRPVLEKGARANAAVDRGGAARPIDFAAI